MQQISFNNQKDILHNTKCCQTLVTKVAKHFVILVKRKETYNFKGPIFIDFIQYFLSLNLLMIASIQSNYLLFLFRHACQARLARHQVRDNSTVCSFLKLLRDKPSGQDSSPNTRVYPRLGLPDPLCH